MPRSVGFSDYDAYKDNDWKRADGKPAGYLIDTGANANNPYWSAYRNTNKDKKDRFIGFAALVSRLRLVELEASLWYG